MKKQVCTVFLVWVLAIQTLPVRQMGCLLFSNQFTEEVPHSFSIEKGSYQKAYLKNDYLPSAFATPLSTHSAHRFLQRHFADAIPQNFSGDIHVPPPNS